MNNYGPLNTEKDGPRVIRCTIEMDLIEGEHFNPFNHDISDELAISYAITSFLDNLNIENIDAYIQTKIVDEPS